jgi:hypothetical protein
MNTTATPATDKQRQFIERLLAAKDLRGTIYEGWNPDWSRATKASASSVIDALLDLTDAPQGTGSGHPSEPQAGVYVYAGDQYLRVYRGQQSGRMLAKRIHFGDAEEPGVSYEYLGLAGKVLRDAGEWARLEVSEVGMLGIHSGTCLICGRRLDDPESVDRGIGPVCAANY